MNKLVVLPFATGTIAASGTFTSEAIDMAKYSNEWRLSLQFTVTGDGTLKIEVLSSNDGVNFVDTAVDVIVGAVKTGGPATNGKYAPATVTIPVARWIKLLFTETGGAQSVACAATLAIQ